MSLDLLNSACRSLLERRNDFWLLAPLVDNSYEEGARNASFGRTVSAWEQAGLHSGTLKMLRGGINGNLADEIRNLANVIEGSVCQNPSRCPDISFRTDSGESHIESKLVFDCTTLKYYPTIPSDGYKLQRLKGQNSTLLQVVFFVQLPNHYYPAGRWRGSYSRGLERPKYLIRAGIQSQYRELMRHMPGEPTLQLHTQPLAFPTEVVSGELIRRFFAGALVPDNPNWSVNADQTFRDAAIGFAVWQC